MAAGVGCGGWLRRPAELIRDLGLADLTVVGHELGGMVTYALLRRHPELLEARRTDEALRPGFSWYRALGRYAEHDVADATGEDGAVVELDTPAL